MRLKRWIFTAAVILWMVLIFSFSAKPADQSADMSLSVGKILGSIFVKDYEKLSEKEQADFAETIDYPVRKTAHATEYMILGILLVCMLQSYGCGSKKLYVCSFLFGTVYAASDEFHQLFVPGRSCQLSDVLLDSAGVLVGVGVVCLMKKLLSKRKS